jgi:hypothetical protein
MKRGAIVPQIVLPGRLPFGHIGDDPFDQRRAVGEPRPRNRDGFIRQIKHREVAMALIDQDIHEARGSAADIDNR